MKIQNGEITRIGKLLKFDFPAGVDFDPIPDEGRIVIGFPSKVKGENVIEFTVNLDSHKGNGDLNWDIEHELFGTEYDDPMVMALVAMVNDRIDDSLRGMKVLVDWDYYKEMAEAIVAAG